MTGSNKSNSGAASAASAASAGGVGSVGVVQIVFLILKICKTAPIGGWPWWKVMLPMECSVGLICSVGCCAAGCGVIALCFSKDVNVVKPGSALTEEQLLMFEKSLETNLEQSVDSEATTSPSRHFSKQSLNDENNMAIGTIVEEGQYNIL